MISLQVPALQENNNIVQGACSDNSSLTSLIISRVAETIQKCFLQLLNESLQSAGLGKSVMVDPTTSNQDVGDSDERPTKKGKKSREQ